MRGRQLKARLVLAGLKQYEICPKVGLNASLLNRILNDRIVVESEVYERIEKAIEDATREPVESQTGGEYE